MEQETCLDCGCSLPMDISHCPDCGKKMANDRVRRERRGQANRRRGEGQHHGSERRDRERRKVNDRRKFSY